MSLWQEYCPGAELPITFEIRDAGIHERKAAPAGWRCIICDLARVRNGRSMVLGQDAVTCHGGRFFLGYDLEHNDQFRYFLSNGRPGEIQGERYKRGPEIVDEIAACHHALPVGDQCYSFKRWDHLTAADNPEVAIFFARPEVLSSLFTLANFDRADPNGVICPFGSGCSSIIHNPRLEQQSDDPRAVLGMFDPSARPCVPLDTLTIAIPMKKFEEMIGYMGESFLITSAWDKVKGRIVRSNSAP